MSGVRLFSPCGACRDRGNCFGREVSVCPLRRLSSCYGRPSPRLWEDLQCCLRSASHTIEWRALFLQTEAACA